MCRLVESLLVNTAFTAVCAAAASLSVVCGSCENPLYPLLLVSGARAYGNTCGCRLRPTPAWLVEAGIATARRHNGGSLRQVRIGTLPEEVTCIWT